MAVSVKHAFVSAIPDSGDTTIVQPSNWNDEHTIVGLGTAAEANTGDFATSAQGLLADSAVQPGDLAAVATSGAYSDLSGTPTLGTAAAADVGDFATAAQGTKADSALQPAAIGVSVQAYDADLSAWAGVTRASGFDTFSATPSSANLRSLLTDESGTGAALFAGTPGTNIANTPAGNIAATTVQAAINELDTEKLAASYIEVGTWTPTIEFLTMGDLSVAYDGTQPRAGTYLRVGDEVFVNYDVTFTPTFTTAASQLRIKTLPFTVFNTGFGPVVAGTAPGTMPTFPASTTALIGFAATDQGVAIRAEGSGATSTVLSVTQITSGVKRRLRGSFSYTRSV